MFHCSSNGNSRTKPGLLPEVLQGIPRLGPLPGLQRVFPGVRGQRSVAMFDFCETKSEARNDFASAPFNNPQPTSFLRKKPTTPFLRPTPTEESRSCLPPIEEPQYGPHTPHSQATAPDPEIGRWYLSPCAPGTPPLAAAPECCWP